MKLPITSTLILSIVLLSLPTTSFQQDDNDESVDPWSFNLEFVKDIILVGIPTVAGIIVTKKLTDSWQEKKTRLEIHRKLISEYDNSVVAYGLRILTFDRILWDSYTKISNDTKIIKHGKLSGVIPNFPKDEKELPQNKLQEEYISLSKDTGRLFNEMWKLKSSLNFYYKDKKIDEQCGKIITNIRPTVLEVQKMYFSTTYEEFKNHHNTFGELYTELHSQFKEFRNKLLETKIDKSLFR
ncbi:MAG: hypothetical protein IIC67_02095 [Thaumarchaeota archaeon]|nr:hypothetical protein [Nitrososphaerota archaeon]